AFLRFNWGSFHSGNRLEMPNLKPSRTQPLAILCLFLALVAQASALSIGDTRDLGLISKNYPADPISSASFINILLDQPLGSGPALIGANTYTRTTNNPLGGLYPDAIFDVDLGATT